MSKDSETKHEWHTLASGCTCMNTATGCVTALVGPDGQSSQAFIPGERWDPDKGEFVAIKTERDAQFAALIEAVLCIDPEHVP